MPRIPKDVIYRAADLMVEHPNHPVETICRRIIVVGINHGLPLNLFDVLREMNITEDRWPYKSTDFDRILIDFANINPEQSSFLELELRNPIDSVKKFIRNCASEHDLRSLFWDSVFTTLLLQALRDLDNAPNNFRVSSEWNFSSLEYQNENQDQYDTQNKIVDFVVLSTSFGKEIPILLIEVGKENFGINENSHKDFSKMIPMMCICCYLLALLLEANGKKAENARIYGVWVGRFQFQACVAYPKIERNPESGLHEITIHIYFPPEWKFDILDSHIPPLLTETGPNVVHVTPSQKFVPGRNNIVTNYLSDPTVPHFNEDTINIIDDQFYTTTSEPAVTFPNDLMYGGILNLDSLWKLKTVFKAVFENLNIHGQIGEYLTLPRSFSEYKPLGLIIPSRPSSFHLTPGSHRLGTAPAFPHSQEPHSPTVGRTRAAKRNGDMTYLRKILKRNFGIELRKKSRMEYIIYKDYIGGLPQYFPKVFYAVQDKDDPEYYYFGLDHIALFLMDNGKLSGRFDFEDFKSGFITILGFAIEILNGIQILHDWFGIVHSDISPSNIGYDFTPTLWKLFDFDQAMFEEESARTVRVAGTPGYTAPESLRTGIFTKASDIWSFGNVIFVQLLLPLMNYVDYSKRNGSIPQELLDSYYEYEAIIISMIASDPSIRPTARGALEKLFPLVEKYQSSFAPFNYVYKRVSELCRGNDIIEITTTVSRS